MTYVPSNNPALTERDLAARRLWETRGVVDFDYMREVLGDPATSVSTARPFRTEEELAETPSPFGPEPEWK
jgi:hypothetical protein